MNRNVSLGLEAVIDKALEKDRNLRYQSVAEMRTDVQGLQREVASGHVAAVSLGAVATTAKVAKVPKKNRWVIIGGGVESLQENPQR